MIAERYVIEDEIKRGAFGVIYKGKYKTREPVAIKMEHNAMSSLSHEVKIIQYLYMANVRNIPSVYWFGKHMDKPCFVMSFYECSLYDYYLSNKVMTSEKMFLILLKITEILENIHKRFVLHRDIKPQNFMIKNGDIYLIDFGLAMFYINEEGNHYPDKFTETMIGSPIFVSINVHRGHRYSRRDDLISLVYLYLFMLGYTFHGEPEKTSSDYPKTDYPKIHIEHPCNQCLKQKKEYETLKNADSKIEYYMKYTYSIKYEETPKYDLLQQHFMKHGKPF
jgi:casein kinase I family protein HRR25